MDWSCWLFCQPFGLRNPDDRLPRGPITGGHMAGGFEVTVDFKGVEKMCERLKKELATAKGVKAGYFKGNAYPNGWEYAKNALTQEFGSQTNNIPPRPFMRNAVDKDEGKWGRIFQDQMERELPLFQCLKQVGIAMQNSIAASIDRMEEPPNAPSTIRQKGSAHPLIDMGRLKNSAAYEVIKNDTH